MSRGFVNVDLTGGSVLARHSIADWKLAGTADYFGHPAPGGFKVGFFGSLSLTSRNDQHLRIVWTRYVARRHHSRRTKYVFFLIVKEYVSTKSF